MRLHELAKEMEADSKELLALAKKLGLPIKSHSSNLAPGETALLRLGYRYRDLDEDELFDRLENLEEEKKLEEEQKKADEEKAKAERARKLLEEKEEREREEAAAAEPVPEPVEEPEAEPVEEVAAVEAETVEVEAPVEVESEPEGEPVVVEGEAEEDDALPVTPAETVVTAQSVVLPVAEHAPVGTEAAAKEEEARREAAEAESTRRRGAKILGRIELDSTEVKKAEATHDELDRTLHGTTAQGRRGGSGRPGAGDNERTRQRRKQSGRQQSNKWQADLEEFSPVGAGLENVALPRFFDRLPTTMRRPTQPVSRRKRAKGPKKNPLVDKKILVEPPISVKDFSQETGIRANDILGKLMSTKGMGWTMNSELDEELILHLAIEFSRDIDVKTSKTAEDELMEKEGVPEDSGTETEPSGPDPRPPVVVFMGHVDHGKTSLLDRIREAQVAAGEAGGITQHVSAYQVKTPSGQIVTFLDTPGHRAFTEMRARGANCTDIVVLVVAADDGVMPQTEEALQHARAAAPNMPIVVALNKVDKPEADPMRVKQQLMAQDLLPEEFGGSVGVIETSAQTGQGIDALLERLALEAELHELRATQKKRARGYVLEATKEEGKGIVATVLVRDGTLKPRDPFLCGKTWGKVRIMEDERGKRMKSAGPSAPVRVYGFKGDLPSAGDLFLAVEGERDAERVATERVRAEAHGEVKPREMVTLDTLFQSLEAGKVAEIKVVLKADVQGTLEVLRRELDQLKHEEVEVRLLRSGVGGITEDDIILAGTSEAIVVGFGVTAEGKARRSAERLGVEIRNYSVIYELLDDLKKAMAGVLSPEESERIVGHAEIRQVFKVSRLGSIAGCYVTDGVVRRTDKVRVIREGKVIYTSTLDSLKRFKEDVREVKENFECGLKVAAFDDIKVGDVVEAFEVVFEERELSIQ